MSGAGLMGGRRRGGLRRGGAVDARDTVLTALSTGVTGWSLVDSWFHDSSLVGDAGSFTGWTGYRNGLVIGPTAGQTAVVTNSALRGVAEITIPNLNPASGLIVAFGIRRLNGRVSVRDGVVCLEGTGGASAGRFFTLAAPHGANRAIYNDTNGANCAVAYSLTPSVATNEEFTHNIFALFPGGTNGAIAVNKESAVKSTALAGSALADGSYKLTLNKQLLLGGAAQYDVQDVAYLIVGKATGLTTAQFGPLIDAIVRDFGTASGRYPLESRTETCVRWWGDSIMDGDTGGVATTPIPTQFHALTGRTASVLKDRAFGGFSVGDTLANGGDPTFMLLAADDRDYTIYQTNPQYAHNAAFIWAGTNDIASLGRTPAATAASLDTLVARVIASGVPPGNIWVSYMMSRISAAIDISKNTLNTAIDVICAKYGVHAFNPGASDLVADGSYANSPPFNAADKTHLLAAYHATVAGRIDAGITAYSGMA